MIKNRLLTISTSLLLLYAIAVQAQSVKTTGEGTPVIFRGETLFSIYSSIGPFSVQERARAIAERLEKIYQDKTQLAGTVTVDSSEQVIHLSIGSTRIMSITEEDVKATGKVREELAEEYAAKLSSIFATRHREFNIRDFFYENKKIFGKKACGTREPWKGWEG